MPAAARGVRCPPCYSSPHPGGLQDAMKLPARVTICEVGTRDGFQIEPDFIPTEQKVEVVNLLSAAGLPRIEVTSFVHPKAVPQLRDAEEVMARITRRPGTRYAALVPNEKGAARAIGLADTTGMANPRQVGRVLEHLVPRFPGTEWTLHTHDTRAMAIPNILAAMEHGVTNFDASIGGLGGCPFAPGASGNVCSEDLVHCLHAMGVQTGIDLDRLLGVSRRVQEIVGRALPGQLVKAGPSTRKYPVPDTVAAKLSGATRA